MPLSPDVAEVVREAALEVMTRKLSAEDVWGEVLRLVREADTPEKVEAIGNVIGKIRWLADAVRAAGLSPTPEPPSAAAAESIPWLPDDMEEVA